ncbi:MAG: hypothetical protein ACYDA0_04960 [Candidatus Dormibacteraceae bacterium]
MATGATVRILRRPFPAPSSLSSVVAAVVVVVVLVAAFEASERMIVCPAHGVAGGGGTGLVTDPYHYDCVNGRLSFHSGSCSSTSMDSSGNVTHPAAKRRSEPSGYKWLALAGNPTFMRQTF